MVDEVSVGGIVKTSIVTAFTIATALIWKDVISEFIGIIFPGDVLFYKFVAAVVATLVIVVVIYFILKAEAETEVVWSKIKKKKFEGAK